jgi:Methyltransferase domain
VTGAARLPGGAPTGDDADVPAGGAPTGGDGAGEAGRAGAPTRVAAAGEAGGEAGGGAAPTRVAAAGEAAALRAVAGVEGWLTAAQARRLWARGAGPRPAGEAVEIGSFRGRSTIVLALAAGAVVAIDSHAGGDRGPREIAPQARRGDADHDAFHANLAAAGVAGRVRHVRRYSDAAHGDVAGPLSLLFVDGAHRFSPALADLSGWGARVAPGGTMLVHDAFSSVGVTLALLVTAVPSRRWRYAGRTGSLAEYERLAAPAKPRAWAASAARQLAELPWFARNVAIKALVVAGRRRWAERLGLDPAAPWPY